MAADQSGTIVVAACMARRGSTYPHAALALARVLVVRELPLAWHGSTTESWHALTHTDARAPQPHRTALSSPNYK